MQKVITINLNGNAYQLDEAGYDALRAYLSDAEARLAGNPDRAEIIKDLEQSVAEKCLRTLGREKTVVSTAEMEQILREVGPVDGDAGSAHAGARSAAAGGIGAEPASKRLYQVRKRAMISGVCTGLAAYFNIDPAFVRVALLGLTFFHGVGFALYILLMLLVPYDQTPEELASRQRGHTDLPDRVQRVVEKFRSKFMEKPWWKGNSTAKL